MMAEVPKQDVMERQWILQALTLQRTALKRSRDKEMVGSEIHRLRGKEIEFLDQLINKFS